MRPSPRVLAHALRGGHALFARLFAEPWYGGTLTSWVEQLDLDPRASVVDVGCAGGDLTGWLASRGHDALGIDVSAAAVASAARRFPSARFERASATMLPVADASVSAVLGASVLNVVPDARAVVAEAARALAPGGVAAFLGPAVGFTDDDARRVITERGLTGFGAAALRTWHASARPLDASAAHDAMRAAGLASMPDRRLLGGMVVAVTGRRS